MIQRYAQSWYLRKGYCIINLIFFLRFCQYEIKHSSSNLIRSNPLQGSGCSISTTFCAWFFKKNISPCYDLLTEQISLSGCLYFLRYWSVCVLRLLVNQFLTSQILKLTLSFSLSRFSTWPKNQDKKSNISRMRRVFKVK